MAVSFDDFKLTNRKEWIEKINVDLKGKKSASDFIYFVEPGLEIDPFLTHQETIERLPVNGPKTRSGVSILKTDSVHANADALLILSKGAEALSFKVDDATNFDTLFAHIFLNMITTVLHFKNVNDFIITKLKDYLQKNYSGKHVDIITEGSQPIIGYKYVVVELKSSDGFIERVCMMTQSLNLWVEKGSYAELAVRVSLKKDFLAQIAELRAIRIIWANLLNAHNLPFLPLTILSDTAIISMDDSELNPLISLNYLQMSAFFGLSDLSFGLPFDQDLEETRLSLNIQHVFKEESMLGFVDDPTAGSYIIEAMTDQIAAIVWKQCFKD